MRSITVILALKHLPTTALLALIYYLGQALNVDCVLQESKENPDSNVNFEESLIVTKTDSPIETESICLNR